MMRLANALVLGVALCVPAKAADPATPPSGKLVGAMEKVAALARETVPLAGQEVAVLNQKYAGNRYADLREAIRSRIDLAADIGTVEYMRVFRDHLEANHLRLVAGDVAMAIERLQGVAGLILAEAAAGSPQQERLLKTYQGDEQALAELRVTHRDWQSHLNSRQALAQDRPGAFDGLQRLPQIGCPSRRTCIYGNRWQRRAGRQSLRSASMRRKQPLASLPPSSTAWGESRRTSPFQRRSVRPRNAAGANGAGWLGKLV